MREKKIEWSPETGQCHQQSDALNHIKYLFLCFSFTHHGPYFITYQLEISNSDLKND